MSLPPITTVAGTLAKILEQINATSHLIVHPDDEETARTALEDIPDKLRPTLVVSSAVPKPGTAYYSRPTPIEAIGRHAIETLPTGALLDQRELADAVAAQQESLAAAIERETAPIEVDEKVIAGIEAARFRALQRRIATRVAREVHNTGIDPLALFEEE